MNIYINILNVVEGYLEQIQRLVLGKEFFVAPREVLGRAVGEALVGFLAWLRGSSSGGERAELGGDDAAGEPGDETECDTGL